jgi:uncharacterized protein (TIGR00251 family)
VSAEPFELAEIDSGSCALAVRAQPGAKRSGLAGLWNGHVKVAVRAPAEDGRANDELLAVLAGALELKPKELALVAGERARLKRVRVARSATIVRERLIRALGLE